MKVVYSGLEPKPEFVEWLEGDEAICFMEGEYYWRLRLPSMDGRPYSRFELCYRGMRRASQSLMSLLCCTSNGGHAICIHDRESELLIPLVRAEYAKAFAGQEMHEEQPRRTTPALAGVEHRIEAALRLLVDDPERAREAVGAWNEDLCFSESDTWAYGFAVKQYVKTGRLALPEEPISLAWLDEYVNLEWLPLLLEHLIHPEEAAARNAEHIWREFKADIGHRLRNEEALHQTIVERSDDILAEYGMQRSLYEALEPLRGEKVALVFADAGDEIELSAAREPIMRKCLDCRPLSLSVNDVDRLAPSELAGVGRELDLSKLEAVRFRGEDVWRRDEAPPNR